MSSVAEKIKAKGIASIKKRPLLKQIETAKDIKEAFPEKVRDADPDRSIKGHYHSIANKEPMMTKQEMGKLVSSMRKKGFREDKPIYMYENKVLDGRNRETAATYVGIEAKYKTFEGTEKEAEIFADEENAFRRHKTPDQIAMKSAYCVLDSRKIHSDDTQNKKTSVKTASLETGGSITKIKRCMKIVDLDTDIANDIFEGSLPLVQAERILADKEKAVSVAKAVECGDLTIDESVAEAIEEFTLNKYATARDHVSMKAEIEALKAEVKELKYRLHLALDDGKREELVI